MKEILRRAMDEGREGRVLMIQRRLDAVRDIPPEHQHILKQLRLYGQIVPEGSLFTTHSIH